MDLQGCSFASLSRHRVVVQYADWISYQRQHESWRNPPFPIWFLCHKRMAISAIRWRSLPNQNCCLRFLLSEQLLPYYQICHRDIKSLLWLISLLPLFFTSKSPQGIYVWLKFARSSGIPRQWRHLSSLWNHYREWPRTCCDRSYMDNDMSDGISSACTIWNKI